MQENIYNWEKELAERERGVSLKNILEKDINTQVNTFKGDRKYINKFCDKLAEQI